MVEVSEAWARDRNDFDYSLACGSGQNATVRPIPGVLLIGGADEGRTGEDNATRWFLQRAKGGDYLVLRSNGIGSQADWVCENFRDLINSAAELSIDSRAAANDPEVIQYIRNADALFIAGGDQNEYEDDWEGSAVEDAINDLEPIRKIPEAFVPQLNKRPVAQTPSKIGLTLPTELGRLGTD